MGGRTRGSAAIEVEERARGEGGPCVVCGAIRTTPLVVMPDGAPALVRCAGCGLARLGSVPRLERAEHDDPSRCGRVPGFASALVRDVAAATPGRGQRLRVLRPLARRLAEWAFDVVVPLDGRHGLAVLALGDGEDELCAHLGARGCSVTATDARLAGGALPAASFDAAIVDDRLASERDPLATLRAVARLLRPGARLHVVVPNLASASFACDGLDFPPAARWFFDAVSLATLVEAAGLRIVRGPHAGLARREALRRLRVLRTDGPRAASRAVARWLAAWLRTAGSGDVLRLEAERVPGPAPAP
jgi:SAM-dependent methyltransferase